MNLKTYAKGTKLRVYTYIGEKIKNMRENKIEQVYAYNHVQPKQPCDP